MIDWLKLLKTNDNPHGFELVDLLHQLKEEVEIASSHELQQSTTKEQPFTSGPQTITDEAAKKYPIWRVSHSYWKLLKPLPGST